MAVPESIPSAQDPKGNTQTGSITPSNKSSQSSQASAQNIPQGRSETGGASVIAGAGSRGRRITTGRLGKASFR